MKICYLLESTDLCGGVRVVFDQARALKKRGHRVTVISKRGEHGWYPYEIDVQYSEDLSELKNREFDVLIATFWTTVKDLLLFDTPIKFHLTQGLEFLFEEYSPIKREIEEVYRLPIPKITIGQWISRQLKDSLGEDNVRIYTVGQIVDTDLFRPPSFLKRLERRLKGDAFSLLLPGPYECSVKGVKYALQAVQIVRERGLAVHLKRLSITGMSAEEGSITEINEYYTGLSPLEVVRIYQESDIFLAPSLPEEGFGLPFAEALSTGLPAVATEIPSFLSFDERGDYAYFVPERDPEAMAEGIIKIINDRGLRRKLSKRGREVVRKFRADEVALRIEQAIQEEMRCSGLKN